MIIDTQKRALAIRFRFLVISFASLVSFTGFLISGLLQKYALVFTLIGSGLLVAYVFIHLKKFNYLYFKDEGGIILFRYYNLIPTTLSHNSIEIPKHELAGFEIRKAGLGLREDLVFRRKTKAGLASYPAVSLSTFSQEEKAAITESLNRFLK